jgi:Cu/Ag efflux protein CusF
MALLLALCLVFAAVIPAAAVESSPSSAAATAIKADVLYWEGNELIVKEFSGHEMRLVVTPDTKIEGLAGGRLKTGDKIVAQVTEDKRALSIILQVPDAGSGGSPSGSR